MNETEQTKKEEKPIISPLANEKTYGERVHSRIFNWGLNYWVNLLASAGFSHWASNSTQEIKVPGFEKATPRTHQENLGKWISNQWFMRGYKERQIAEHGLEKGLQNLGKRGFAMAESLTLLLPGFAVVLPSIYLGAKLKPWFVQTLNRWHYGNEAMDDPSLKARHEAIAAAEQPTMLGTVFARLATVGAVQLSAKFIGSESNTVNWLGKKIGNQTMQEFKGINPLAESIGIGVGNAMPARLQENANRYAQKIGLSWSNAQMGRKLSGTYNQALQDILKYVSMDTIYTAVSALSIHPALQLLRHIPGMSHKPKHAANAPTLEGDTVKVPPNRYTDRPIDPASLDATNEPHFSKEQPANKVHHIRPQATLAEAPELATTGAGL